MTAESLLSRLVGVRQVGPTRWRARCPAHDTKNASVLSIGETNDGTVLVRCFAGCSASDVVGALGLELHDLFPRADWQTTGMHHSRPKCPRVDWPALIVSCERDLLLVKVVLAAIAQHDLIDESDATACQSAATRIFTLIQGARNG